MTIYLQRSVPIQKRTSPLKFAHFAEKSGKGSISNLSTKVAAAGSVGRWVICVAASAPAREPRLKMVLYCRSRKEVGVGEGETEHRKDPAKGIISMSALAATVRHTETINYCDGIRLSAWASQRGSWAQSLKLGQPLRATPFATRYRTRCCFAILQLRGVKVVCTTYALRLLWMRTVLGPTSFIGSMLSNLVVFR